MEPATDDELERAKENLKGRVVLALESTGARMNRLGSEILAGAPLLSLDDVVEQIDAVSLEDLAALADELWAPGRLSAAGIGPDEGRFDEAVAAVESRGHVSETRIRVAVAGAAGRMGADRVRGRPGRRGHGACRAGRPGARHSSVADALARAPDVLVDFTIPGTAVSNAREAVAAGVHVVIGTTGFDVEELHGLTGANIFIAPNFAIGAVLMMQFAVQAARHMAKVEIIELHHDRKVDAPSGTAKLDRAR